MSLRVELESWADDDLNEEVMRYRDGIGEINRPIPDYCNSPDIFRENKICLDWIDAQEKWMATEVHGNNGNHFYSFHKNPFRAATIVYILKMDSK